MNEEVAVRLVPALDRTRVVPVDRVKAPEAVDNSLSHELLLSATLVSATDRRFGAEHCASGPALQGLRSGGEPAA